MRQVQHRLGQLLVPREAELIQQKGQDDRYREADQQVQEVEHQAVLQRPEEVPVLENLLKNLETDVFASLKALGRLVVHEGYAQARVGSVFKQENENNRNQDHEIHLPVVLEIQAGSHPFPLSCSLLQSAFPLVQFPEYANVFVLPLS